MSPFPVIVFDFETTGMTPEYGDRPIEVGAVRLENNCIVDRFQGLMNPDCPITRFIEELTGISNEMVAEAPPCEEVISQFADWIADTPLVAHNAFFDRKFLDAEMTRIGRVRKNAMACSMLVARRIFPDSPNHKLVTLVRHCGIFTDGTFHRALADAEMTGHLWLAILEALNNRFGLPHPPFALLQALAKVSRRKTERFLRDAAAQLQRPDEVCCRRLT